MKKTILILVMFLMSDNVLGMNWVDLLRTKWDRCRVIQAEKMREEVRANICAKRLGERYPDRVADIRSCRDQDWRACLRLWKDIPQDKQAKDCIEGLAESVAVISCIKANRSKCIKGNQERCAEIARCLELHGRHAGASTLGFLIKKDS